jgi:DNA modification methylase
VSTRVLVGDALTVLKTLPAESCHVCVTSPPYFQLRDYGVAGQIGLERTPDEYVQKLVEVFREVWRVLRPDATLWLNIGDSMAGSGKGKTGANGIGDQEQRQGFHDNYHLERDNQTRARWPDYGKPKDLLLIPFRLAIALQADGWYVRSDIAWCKKSCMPESVQDRPTAAWEHVFLLSKQPRYYYDAEAVREDAVSDRASGNGYARPEQLSRGGRGSAAPWEVQASRNMRNFWVLGPEPFPSAHFATFVPEIPRRAILAGTSEHGVCPVCGAPWVRQIQTEYIKSPAHGAGSQMRGRLETTDVNGWAGMPRVARVDTTTGWRPSCEHVEAIPVAASVLDPFAGAGTTGLVADRLGRDSILIELNPAYAEMARQRIAGDSPMFTEIVA